MHFVTAFLSKYSVVCEFISFSHPLQNLSVSHLCPGQSVVAAETNGLVSKTEVLNVTESFFHLAEFLLSKTPFIQCSVLTSLHFYLFKVGVHIADVSHFIRPGNALDQESARRGTTVYLCEKVNVLNLKWNFNTCLRLFHHLFNS